MSGAGDGGEAREMRARRTARPRWLRSWEQIRDNGWQDILLGNGASIAIDSSFKYSSLFRVAKGSSYLEDADVEVFEEFDTEDFEEVLHAFDVSIRVNERLGLDASEHRHHYRVIRRALSQAIEEVHPRFQDLDHNLFVTASRFLSRFRRVFTTNYDLLLYWAVMENTDRFRDYFWGEKLSFDPDNIDVPRDRTRVVYLHGALFLFTTTEGTVRKIAATQASDLLTRIKRRLGAGKVPFFVSEGSTTRKRTAVRKNEYLNLGFKELRDSDENLVIFGHSLSHRDNHVVEAINESNRRNIAYSVRKGRKAEATLETLRLGVRAKFPGKRVSFFDAESFPIWEE